VSGPEPAREEPEPVTAGGGGVEPTELLYLRDAYRRSFEATVVAVDGDKVALDRTAFYPTGGGQPHDLGTLGTVAVGGVRKEGGVVAHPRGGPAGDRHDGAGRHRLDAPA
jgi:alanyl-tRNA synthetase